LPSSVRILKVIAFPTLSTIPVNRPRLSVESAGNFALYLA
jgi:hypothetical protein